MIPSLVLKIINIIYASYLFMQSFLHQIYRNFQFEYQLESRTYLEQKEKKLINYIDTFKIIFIVLIILYVNE